MNNLESANYSQIRINLFSDKLLTLNSIFALYI